MSSKIKKIIIMRHANAKPTTPPPGLTDKERPLSKKGWEELSSLGKREREALNQVTSVLCSSATRTRQTLEGIMRYLPNIHKIIYLDELYQAPAWIYLEEINLWEEEHAVLLFVGHNPAVSEFLINVSEAGRGGREVIDSVSTAGICIYDVHTHGNEGIGYGDLKIV